MPQPRQAPSALTAFNVFKDNIYRLVTLFRFVDARIDQYRTEDVPRLLETIETTTKEVPPSTPITELPELATQLADHLYVKDAVNWQMCWYVVMLVTITEAYLRDALAQAAELDSSFMEHSEQSLSYVEVSKQESVQSLAASMRDVWAKGFVESGGPKKWIEKLTRWGARGYPADLAATLEEMWGVRHLVVHRAGRIDSEFRRNHPHRVMEDKQEAEIDGDAIEKYAKAAISFAGTTNRYLVQRCSANS